MISECALALALEREARDDEDDLVPHVATIEEQECGELESDASGTSHVLLTRHVLTSFIDPEDEVDELLPSSDGPDAAQGAEDHGAPDAHPSIPSPEHVGGSNVDITRMWDLRGAANLNIVGAICKEAMGEYRTCVTCEYPVAKS